MSKAKGNQLYLVVDAMEPIFFVTSNPHKLEEANKALSAFSINLKMADCEKVEIQADSLSKIADYAATLAAKKLNAPVLVEDSGLFVKALGGFPGPYTSYVHKTIGCGGLLKLMASVAERRAVFRAAVVYASPDLPPRLFNGNSYGNISQAVKVSQGFGFDPIFIHEECGGRTFAEISADEKTRLSHRGAAFRSFGEWYSGSQNSTSLK